MVTLGSGNSRARGCSRRHVLVLALEPNCHGDSLQETLTGIEQAKEAWLDVALEEGEDIPLPEGEKHSGKFLLRIPVSLHRKLAGNAKRERISLNQYTQYLITSALEARDQGHVPRVGIAQPPSFPVDEESARAIFARAFAGSPPSAGGDVTAA
ncbi:MAG: toxin-antitoxin system HicB family antitoxin [bacterium]